MTTLPPPTRYHRRQSVERLPRTKPVHLHLVTPRSPDAPRLRSECQSAERPCLFVACKFSLYLDVTRAGSLVVNFADLEPDEMGESCALDIAARGGESLDVVARAMGLTKQRVAQIEERALSKLSARSAMGAWR